MPQNETTIATCQPSQRGWIRNRHTGPDEGASEDGCEDGCDGTAPGLSASVPAFSMP